MIKLYLVSLITELQLRVVQTKNEEHEVERIVGELNWSSFFK